ncbi:ABC transporter permease [Salinifilum aidingensis]
MSTNTASAERAAAPRGPRALAGTGALLRLALRRDRLRIPVWLVAVIGTVVGSAASFGDIFRTDAEVATRIALIQGNPAGVALTGPGYGLERATLEHLGPMIASELSATTLILVALLNIFLLVRHTRAEEENGRAELLRAAAVGRHAPLTASALLAFATDAVLGAGIAGGLGAVGFPWPGSAAFGAGAAALGLVFAGVAAAAAQVTEYARAAVSLAATVFGLAFAVRAVGDARGNALSWFSPLGWAQGMRPYADERWWPLVLLLAAALLLAALAYALSARRDLGAGLRRARPGRSAASPALTTPFGLAFRQQRASLLGWGAGLLAGGATGGMIAGQAGALTDIRIYRQLFGGGDLTDSVFGFYFLFLAVLAGGYALQTILRTRGEEASGLLEPVLAAAVPRWRWTAAHLGTALLGSAIVLLAGGLGAGAAHAANTGEFTYAGGLVLAPLAYLPALAVLVGLAFALFGLAPRAVAAVWIVLGHAFFAAMFGQLLGLPDWVRGLSPFAHVPEVPSEQLAAAPLTALTGLAAALGALGLLAFRRRDLAA